MENIEQHLIQNPPNQGFKLRLLSFSVCILFLLYYAKYMDDRHDDSNTTFTQIPMYIELNEAFEKLAIFIDYNKPLLQGIHKTVLAIVTIQIEEQQVDTSYLAFLQLTLRKDIDAMALYIPNDIDFRDIWDVNIQLIIKVVNKIISNILKN
tara:strand:- start:348 stop:800 length:453 start_codon:yes stop_codon:yes gene_type:complete